jgi:hypothetical protein
MRLVLLCRRPAVSMRTTSASFSAAGLDRVEGDRGGVGAVAVGADGRHADALAPGLQLVGGRRTEGVCRTEERRPCPRDEHAGELADGRGLARCR